MSNYRFKKLSDDPEIRRMQLEIQDNFVAHTKNGDVVVDGDMTVKDLYANADSIYLGGIKFSSPKVKEDAHYLKYNKAQKKMEYVDTASSTAHASSHENGGSDEIDLSGLSGTPADLTTHEADTTTHGTTGDIVGTSDTQIITNKKFGGATDYSEFEADGTLVAKGAAATWDDQQVSMGDIAGKGWFGNQWSDVIEYRSGIALRLANSTSNNYKFKFNCQLSHKYQEGEDIKVHLHIGNNSSTSGDVVLKITWEWANVDGTYGSSTTETKTFSVTGTDGLHEVFSFSNALSGTSKEISSIVIANIERLASDSADTFSEDLYVIGLDYHIPLDTVGSRQEWIK